MKTLFITVDAWRASHASFYPNVANRYTPTLEALAEEGTAFTQAVSHGPATPYAFPAIFSSALPLDYGGYEQIAPGRTLVSEALSDAGWRCVGVHGNPWLGEKYGYGRGYDEYRDVGEFSLPLLDGLRETLIERFGLDHPVYEAAQYAYRHAQKPLQRVSNSGSDEVAVASEALDEADDDTFVWTHLLAPHAPYAPPKRHQRAVGIERLDVSPTTLSTRAQRDPESLSELEREAVRRLYAASVRHADEQIGELLAHVDDDTLVVVTADHGEALFEHGQVGHEPCLYDELIHVPLLIRPPESAAAAGAVIDSQVRHVDIAPTILDYAGVDAPESFEGRSLRPLIESGAEDDESDGRLAVSEVASTARTPGRLDEGALQISVRRPDRKLIFDADETTRGFDLDSDPGEVRPIADPVGDGWEELRDALSNRLDEIEFGGGSVERDAEVERRLQELGYLE
jgi:arylsulfatase A-like enzyme